MSRILILILGILLSSSALSTDDRLSNKNVSQVDVIQPIGNGSIILNDLHLVLLYLDAHPETKARDSLIAEGIHYSTLNGRNFVYLNDDIRSALGSYRNPYNKDPFKKGEAAEKLNDYAAAQRESIRSSILLLNDTNHGSGIAEIKEYDIDKESFVVYSNITSICSGDMRLSIDEQHVKFCVPVNGAGMNSNLFRLLPYPAEDAKLLFKKHIILNNIQVLLQCDMKPSNKVIPRRMADPTYEVSICDVNGVSLGIAESSKGRPGSTVSVFASYKINTPASNVKKIDRAPEAPASKLPEREQHKSVINIE